MRDDQPADCPECHSAGSMNHGYCQVCYAAPIGHPVRFSDVIAELRVESLLRLLREQFMRDVVLGRPAPQPVA